MVDYVVIPAHNEEKNISNVIKEVKTFNLNIVVIDDGSKDKTYEEAKSQNVVVLRHKVNLGKGAALKTGCDYAYEMGAENIVVLDADGQHNPKEIPVFLDKLKSKDIVFGYRKGDESMPGILKFGNWFINQTLYRLYGMKVKDSQSGYRAFTSNTYKKIRWKATDYYMETEMLIKAGKKSLNYAQVPIETIYNDKYKGTTVLDGAKIVFSLFLWRVLR